MGYPDDGVVEFALQPLDQIHDLGFDSDVEGGGRFVGDKEIRVAYQGHGDHRPLAHAARKLVRICLEPLAGAGDAHELEHLRRPLPRLPPIHLLVRDKRLRQLVPDGVDGIEGDDGILEHDGDLVAPDTGHLIPR